MRDYLQSGGRFLRNWCFWAFVLLVLPNCGFDYSGLCLDPPCDEDPPSGNSSPAFLSGDNPTDTIMCEIRAPELEGQDYCADVIDAGDPTNVWLTQAATALATTKYSSFALDWSDPGACLGGLPKKIEFLGGLFPDGHHLCINCMQQVGLQKLYATPTDACVAKCKDLIDSTYPEQFTPEERDAHCEANTRTATNWDKTMCFPNGCTGGGNPVMGFSDIDPRRHPEPVHWVDLTPGVTDNGGTNSLARTTLADGEELIHWNQGAASLEIIESGDAWIDFSSTSTDGAHAIGVRESRKAVDLKCLDVSECEDDDPSLDNIGFAIDLNHTANVFVIESPPFTVQGPFPPPNDTYAPGERFRVHIRDKHNGTAEISYFRVPAGCVDGMDCLEGVMPFHTSDSTPRYPLRVDASFRDPSGFANVNIVRIKP